MGIMRQIGCHSLCKFGLFHIPITINFLLLVLIPSEFIVVGLLISFPLSTPLVIFPNDRPK